MFHFIVGQRIFLFLPPPLHRHHSTINRSSSDSGTFFVTDFCAQSYEFHADFSLRARSSTTQHRYPSPVIITIIISSHPIPFSSSSITRSRAVYLLLFNQSQVFSKLISRVNDLQRSSSSSRRLFLRRRAGRLIEKPTITVWTVQPLKALFIVSLSVSCNVYFWVFLLCCVLIGKEASN